MKTTPLTLRRKLALEIARYTEKQQVKEHPLRQLFWECTLRCNLNCRHCGSDCKKTAGISDMPKEDVIQDIDGEANGGEFEGQGLSIKDFEKKQVKKGDGWYSGELEFSKEIQLTKRE